MTEQDLKAAKLSDDDVQWLLGHMKEQAAEEEQPAVQEEAKVLKPDLKGLKIGKMEGLNRLKNFIKQYKANKKANQVEGAKKYDFVHLINDVYQ